MGYVNPKWLKKSQTIPAPQIESPLNHIVDFNTHYPPEGFGVIHRAWEPRLVLAGTSAHPDLIYPDFLVGDEKVVI